MSEGGGSPANAGGAGDGTRLWRTLAAAGREAIAEALTEEDFERLHIESGIERFLGEQVRAGRNVVVTGNAGDGKTHLLRRVKRDLESAGAVVVEDATAEMRGGDPSPILEKWRETIEGGQPFCLAANEYPLYQLRMADVSAPHLVEVGRQCQHRLAYGDDEDSGCVGNVVVIDLSLRNPLGGEFFDALLDKLLDDEGVKAALASPAEAVVRRNAERLAHPQVREAAEGACRAYDRARPSGDRARAVDPLSHGWCSGTGERGEYQRTDWYSEALFERDDRFDLTEALLTVDPAGCSHPLWDSALDARAPEVREGWVLQAPLPAPHPTLDWEDFAALKRRFYFEHAKGEEVFDLDPTRIRRTSKISCRAEWDRVGRWWRSLVDAINAAYCPLRFDSRDQHLYLWNGHRFHEQPSRSFVAAERVATDDLVTEVPRLPARLEECFEYRPDHIALTAPQLSGTPRLRIDFPLWRTLLPPGARPAAEADSGAGHSPPGRLPPEARCGHGWRARLHLVGPPREPWSSFRSP